jgi:hypothetical protein
MALRNISMTVGSQAQLDSILYYLGRQRTGQRIDSLRLRGIYGMGLRLRWLPVHLQLHSLDIACMAVQLQPGNGFEGILRLQQQPLKKLRLVQVHIFDSHLTLPAGSSLQHLELSPVLTAAPKPLLAVEQLQQQQQLTYLDLAGVPLQYSGQVSSSLQFVGVLDQLRDLRVMGAYDLPQGVLANLTKLERIILTARSLAVGVLLELQRLQELSHLVLGPCHWQQGEDPPSAASFASLTASSKLKDLGLLGFKCAEGAWQVMFPTAGRRLPQLRGLTWNNGLVEQVPTGSSLVCCCPGLVMLNAHMPRCTACAELLSPLTALTGLSILVLGLQQLRTVDHLLICRLTGLKKLGVTAVEQSQPQLSLWELSSLQQLQFLAYSIPGLQRLCLFSKVSRGCAPSLLEFDFQSFVDTPLYTCLLFGG